MEVKHVLVVAERCWGRYEERWHCHAQHGQNINTYTTLTATGNMSARQDLAWACEQRNVLRCRLVFVCYNIMEASSTVHLLLMCTTTCRREPALVHNGRKSALIIITEVSRLFSLPSQIVYIGSLARSDGDDDDNEGDALYWGVMMLMTIMKPMMMAEWKLMEWLKTERVCNRNSLVDIPRASRTYSEWDDAMRWKLLPRTAAWEHADTGVCRL